MSSSEKTSPEQGQGQEQSARTVVLCLDGTAGKYGPFNTNVVKLFEMLDINTPDKQLCYYQPGCGTYFATGVVSQAWDLVAKMADLAVAWYLNDHVMQAYKFLMNNYKAGDKVCIFGFSRGAYTARALAGLLNKIGLLPKNNEEQIGFAYEMYRSRHNHASAAGFKATFCVHVDIEFLGVWDTVQSVGLFYSKPLPFTDSNTQIKTFRHALALDERRGKFQPNCYHYPSPNPEDSADYATHGLVKHKLVYGRKALQESDTDVVEVWFAGGHTDIGGGEPFAEKSHPISDIPLRWMVKEIQLSQCGIIFDPGALDRMGIDPKALVENPKEYSNTDKRDVTAAVHDALRQPVQRWFWWMLEIIPFGYKYQDVETGAWGRLSHFPHLGRPRRVTTLHPHFHASVAEKMKVQNYKPSAIYVPGHEVYVN